ncbi:CCR4-NOT transcription complex subunit 7 isoform X2 [Brachionus plicatilis]|uniref:poly(A)-specific ribonuclease n=1 Tax=Brachionus plicatilis TaxID=10195 RepID=A0A3M7P2V7_BRAPC|nr:CCR4-NOT transcription complex subunit 7 isoform X2 [Brachionus plicatilis]
MKMKESTSPNYTIIEVWNNNLEDEFKKIRKIIQKYPYVAMDTEFPGVVAKIIGDVKTPDYQYQCLKCNVDLLKIIQLGFTFMDEKGNVPSEASTFQFNFHFNINEDMYAQESIDLLSKSGIVFQKNLENGIDPMHFAELLTSSGVVLVENVTWISFHSSYDFGYMIKLLTNRDLPGTEVEFLELLKIYFPNVFDIKYLMKSCRNLKGGLEEVARQLEIERFGPQHQAGSDSLLTGLTFFKLKEMYFEDTIDQVKYSGQLFGLGSSLFQNGYVYDTYINPQTLVSVVNSVAQSANAHNSQSQSSLSTIASQNGQNSASTPNLSALNGPNDPSRTN